MSVKLGKLEIKIINSTQIHSFLNVPIFTVLGLRHRSLNYYSSLLISSLPSPHCYHDGS